MRPLISKISHGTFGHFRVVLTFPGGSATAAIAFFKPLNGFAGFAGHLDIKIDRKLASVVQAEKSSIDDAFIGVSISTAGGSRWTSCILLQH